MRVLQREAERQCLALQRHAEHAAQQAAAAQQQLADR